MKAVLLTGWQCPINNGEFYAACFQLTSDCEDVFLAEAHYAVAWSDVVKRHCSHTHTCSMHTATPDSEVNKSQTNS